MQQLRRGRSLLGYVSAPQLKKKAVNSWVAVQDTFYSTKDTFERHRVVFTVGTSIASVATAWFGYSLRHYHQNIVDQRLESIEKAMKKNIHLEHTDLKKIVDHESTRSATCFATAATSLFIGYALGWRGGRWYANRQHRKEQLKQLGLIKPQRWQLLRQIRSRGIKFQSLKRRLLRNRAPETPESLPKDFPTGSGNAGETVNPSGTKVTGG